MHTMSINKNILSLYKTTSHELFFTKGVLKQIQLARKLKKNCQGWGLDEHLFNKLFFIFFLRTNVKSYLNIDEYCFAFLSLIKC